MRGKVGLPRTGEGGEMVAREWSCSLLICVY